MKEIKVGECVSYIEGSFIDSIREAENRATILEFDSFEKRLIYFNKQYHPPTSIKYQKPI